MSMLTDQDRNAIYKTACLAARESGAILKDSFGRQKEIMYKGVIDPVTNVDLQSEKTIIDIIRSRHPDHDIVSEETDITQTGSPVRWIIDPLDGTVNYAHDYPFVAVSIGVEVEGDIEVGVVYNPIWEEFFHAQRDGGAYCNETKISVSKIETIEKSLLATGFSYDIRETSYNNIQHFNHMMMKAQALRRDGSAALNLCYTAMGRFDGYWEIKIQPWDIAAGMLIVAEAGGTVTDLAGKSVNAFRKEVLVSNGTIHRALIDEIQYVQKKYYNK
ncbi:inositol monophosphatase family protein [Candidatus Latescibacterota bacterium]